MPPRHHYWTIIVDDKPTAFRAAEQEELMPTLRQLQARHPDAVMKWFARGRLWESQDIERADAAARRRPPAGDRRPPAGDRRGREWRPGGEHKDPRDRFKIPRDEKRRRFAENLFRDRSEPPPQTAEKQGDDVPPPRPSIDGTPRDNRGATRPWSPAGARGGKPAWNRDGARGTKPGNREGDHGGKPPWKRDGERAANPSSGRDGAPGPKPA